MGVGVAVGVAASAGLLAVTSPRGATDTAFALGALVFGFGVTAWSGAIGLGESVERMQEYRDGESEWTQAGARRAFAVLTWTGFGWVIGSVAASIVAVGV
ncbi:hypothetical protein SAMN06265347_11735 [Halobellus salinus]|nr:hypothetical protein SAMN06265347_11735 [Halobellus salinus]